MMNLKVFKNCIGKEITIEFSSKAFRTGIITEFDDFGIYFVPSENTSDMIIAWHNINKVIMDVNKLVVIEPFNEG